MELGVKKLEETVGRRAFLKRLGVGIAGLALVCGPLSTLFGLDSSKTAGKPNIGLSFRVTASGDVASNKGGKEVGGVKHG